jgi:hypothetical protein
MIALLAGMIRVITAIATGTLALFIAATVVASANQGVANQGVAISAATRGLLHGAPWPTGHRSSVSSTSPATAPLPPQSHLRPASSAFSQSQIALWHGALALIAPLFPVIAARNPRTDTTGNSQPSE